MQNFTQVPQDSDASGHHLLITAPTGSGKYRLLAAVAKRAHESGKSVSMTSVTGLSAQVLLGDEHGYVHNTIPDRPTGEHVAIFDDTLHTPDSTANEAIRALMDTPGVRVIAVVQHARAETIPQDIKNRFAALQYVDADTVPQDTEAIPQDIKTRLARRVLLGKPTE